MSARMQFCGRFPGLCAVSGIWSGAAADSLSLGSKRSGCVGLHSTQPKHRRFETVRLSASRGDISRSTEGSGLGLSIAQNLTTLQKGTFEIYLDGDLFKVQIGFSCLDVPQPEIEIQMR